MGIALLVACLLLPLAAFVLPAHLLRRFGVPLVVLSALANVLFISFVAFGEDDYRNNGESRWRTHASAHPYYAVALIVWAIVVVFAVVVRERQRALRRVAACAAVAAPLFLIGSALAFKSN